MKTHSSKRIWQRMAAAMLVWAMSLSILLPAAAANDSDGEWDEDTVYKARVAVMTRAGGSLVQGAYQTVDVKVIDGCLMVNFLWLREVFSLPYACDSVEESFPKDSLWAFLDSEGAAFERSDGEVKTFCVRKETDSDWALYFASGMDKAAVFTPYTGLTDITLATAPVWDKEADTFTVWMPLSDLMFLLDASCMYDGTGIVLYPPEMTVLDLLCRPASRLSDYYCDIFTESGMDYGELSGAELYKTFYDVCKGTLKDISKLNIKGIYNTVFGDKIKKEAGQQLAYEMCTFSQEEYDKQVQQSEIMADYYDGNMILLGELSKLLGEGAGEALGEAERVQQALEALLGQTDAMGEDGEKLVQMLISQDKKVAELGANKAWYDKVGKAVGVGGFVLGELLSTYITYSNLIAEVDSADQNSARSLRAFLTRYEDAYACMAPEVKEGLEGRIAMYEQDRIDMTDEAYFDTHANAVTNSLSSLGGTIAGTLLSKAASAALIKLQLVSIGWTAAEMAVNHVTGGAFDMLDCLDTGLYGMTLESDTKAVLDAYTRDLSFSGPITDPKFDWSRLETYRQLLWAYLKACYVTRSNAIGTWQTEKDNALYDVAIGPYIRLNEKILEEIGVAANGRIGMTEETAAAHMQAFTLENEYFLKAIINIQNNGGLYVQVGEDVYYWRFDAGSYTEGGLFHSFYPEYTEGTNATLVRRAPDGTESELYRDHIYTANLYIFGNTAYYEAKGADGDSIRSVNLDGSEPRTLFTGNIVAMDEGTGTFAYTTYGPSSRLLYVYNTTDGTGQSLYNAYLKTLAVRDGKLYFTTASSEADVVSPILCADLETGAVTTLCTPESMNRSHFAPASEAQQFEILGDYAYFSYGYYDGTGGYYQGGYIARVKLDGTGYERLAGSENMLVGAAFNLCLEKSGALVLSYIPYVGDSVEETYLNPEIWYSTPTSAKNLTTDETPVLSENAGPMDQPFLYRDDICIYEGSEGKIRTLITPEDYASFGYGVYSEDDSVMLRDVEIVGDSVWFVVDGCERDSTMDMGWRPYYKRLASYVCCKDLKKGTVTVVGSY